MEHQALHTQVHEPNPSSLPKHAAIPSLALPSQAPALPPRSRSSSGNFGQSLVAPGTPGGLNSSNNSSGVTSILAAASSQLSSAPPTPVSRTSSAPNSRPPPSPARARPPPSPARPSLEGRPAGASVGPTVPPASRGGVANRNRGGSYGEGIAGRAGNRGHSVGAFGGENMTGTLYVERRFYLRILPMIEAVGCCTC